MQVSLGMSMARTIPAVILAAGASNRLGEPKSMIDFAGLPLVRWAFDHLAAAGCEPIFIVTRAELSVDVLLAVPNAKVSINPNPELGRTGSLQNGISSLFSDLGSLPRKLVIAPVDRPGWNAKMVKELLLQKHTVCPSYKGRKGHPVVINSADMEQILSAPSDMPLRDIVSFVEVSVEAPWLHLNIDTPEDIRNLDEHKAELFAYFRQ